MYEPVQPPRVPKYKEPHNWDDGTHTEELNSSKIWKNQAGKLHRDGDKPAIVWADGDKYWYKNGKRHRDNDKPAVVHSDGYKAWYKNGKCHRDGDKPAIVWADGSKYWYKNGKLHRDGDKPARVWADGSKAWHKNGSLHRDGDKPARVWADGNKEWWVEGEFIRRHEWWVEGEFIRRHETKEDSSSWDNNTKTKTQEKKMNTKEQVKNYLEKHSDSIITVILILIADYFILGGALREKTQAAIEKMLDGASKRLPGGNNDQEKK